MNKLFAIIFAVSFLFTVLSAVLNLKLGGFDLWIVGVVVAVLAFLGGMYAVFSDKN